LLRVACEGVIILLSFHTRSLLRFSNWSLVTPNFQFFSGHWSICAVKSYCGWCSVESIRR